MQQVRSLDHVRNTCDREHRLQEVHPFTWQLEPFARLSTCPRLANFLGLSTQNHLIILHQRAKSIFFSTRDCSLYLAHSRILPFLHQNLASKRANSIIKAQSELEMRHPINRLWLYQFTTALDNQYKSVKKEIIRLDLLPSPCEACTRVLQEQVSSGH